MEFHCPYCSTFQSYPDGCLPLDGGHSGSPKCELCERDMDYYGPAEAGYTFWLGEAGEAVA